VAATKSSFPPGFPGVVATWRLKEGDEEKLGGSLEPHVWRDKIETQVNNTFSLADLVALSMEQRARKAEQAKLIEAQGQAENEE
jgi:hypothetical protein